MSGVGIATLTHQLLLQLITSEPVCLYPSAHHFQKLHFKKSASESSHEECGRGAFRDFWSIKGDADGDLQGAHFKGYLGVCLSWL